MKKNIIILITCIMFSQAFASQDADYVFEQLNNSFAIDLAGLRVNYEEINDFKGTETGEILGFSLDKRITFFRKIYTDLYFDLYSGRLKYAGLHRFTSEASTCGSGNMLLLNANVKAGYVFSAADSFSLQAIPYVGAGYNYWRRGCSWGKFQHNKTIIGMKLDWLLTDDFILSPYFEGGKIHNARLSDSDNVSLALGNKPIYSAGLELNYKIFPQTFLNGFVDFTHFKYGRSETKDGLFAPDSKTNEIKVGLGVRLG